MYLFGFGSLINLNSAQKSFERELSYDDLIPVTIKGFKKVWNSIEHIQFDGVDVNGVFLNLQKDETTQTSGVVVKVTPQEFEILKLREKNYSQVTIKACDVIGAELDEDVVAFMTTNEEKIAKIGNENCFIPAKYIDILTNAFENYDTSFVEQFKKECLEDLPFELKQGTYSFSDPMQQKLAKEGIKK
ncbi:hypothetical protein [Arcobacter roscoffensis]|uniref:Gamma-glutamylcyclotransferase n=1 Tax=Arcobacter roscoffensis TaxID=2961520 RepID=A0ABY5E0D3_9BACT|nr:hypothetical protein [Arcobacter roscoffensis]UTJ05317.1 hypothetical protein NJU99_08555 [Arcobacter roscoffensis]